MPVCAKCPQNGQQPIENFARKGNKHNTMCKVCKRQYNKDHYSRNKASYRQRAKHRKQIVRQWLDDLKSTLKCNRCPESHPATLHFHHTDPKKKSTSIANAIRLGWNEERLLREISLCEVICANCHAKEHWHLIAIR